MEWLLLAASAIAGYFIGCLSFGYISGMIFKRKDIRKYGSGNAGTANMARNFGWKLGALTLIGDAFKGVLACFVGWLIAGGEFGAYIAAIAVIAGHNWPVFLKFKGGKGIATTLGVMLALAPWVGLGAFAVAAILILVTRVFSIGSLGGIIAMFIGSLIFTPTEIFFQPLESRLFFILTIAILLVLAIYSHRLNLVKIFKGKENKISLKIKK